MANKKKHARVRLSRVPPSTKLPGCCQKKLKEIGDLLRTAKVLKATLVGGTIVTFFTEPPELLVNILSQDWEKFAEAVARAKDPYRKQCYTIAILHAADHVDRKEPALERFWRDLAENFA